MILSTTNTSNIFMNVIYEKVNFSFKNFFKYFKQKRKYKKLIKDIQNGSPCFGVLWKMCDFIKLAEIIFFYDNSPEVNATYGLYSSNNYSPGENGMKIHDTEIDMTIKLKSDNSTVIIELERNLGNHHKTKMEFANDNWKGIPDIYDEMILENIIRMINKRFLMLFIDLYDRR